MEVSKNPMTPKKVEEKKVVKPIPEDLDAKPLTKDEALKAPEEKPTEEVVTQGDAGTTEEAPEVSPEKPSEKSSEPQGEFAGDAPKSMEEINKNTEEMKENLKESAAPVELIEAKKKADDKKDKLDKKQAKSTAKKADKDESNA